MNSEEGMKDEEQSSRRRRKVEGSTPDLGDVVVWDNLLSVMGVAALRGRDLREDGGSAPGNQRKMADDLKKLPKFVAYEDIAEVVDGLGISGFDDPIDVFGQLTLWCEELRDLRKGKSQLDEVIKGRTFPRVEFEFHTRLRTQDGILRGVLASQTSVRDRELSGHKDPAWFRLSVSLAFWLVATLDEKRRAMHEACMRCEVDKNESGVERPKKRLPEISSFAATAGRFGVGSKTEAKFWAALNSHPDTEKRVLDYGFGPEGQGELFDALETGKALS